MSVCSSCNVLPTKYVRLLCDQDGIHNMLAYCPLRCDDARTSN